MRSRLTPRFGEQRSQPFAERVTASSSSSAVSYAVRSTLPTSDRFNTDKIDIAKKYENALLSFEGRLTMKNYCKLCNGTFTNALVGSLNCSYHPFFFINCASNGSGERAQDGPVSNCPVCRQLHLLPTIRDRQFDDHPPHGDGIDVDNAGVICDESVRRIGIPLVFMPSTLSRGCVSVDHCTDIYELLNHPYSAVPTIMWEKTVIGKRGELLTSSFSKSAVIVVNDPTQLSKTLIVDIPGSSEPYRRSVEAVYDEMAERLNIQPLADAIYDAKISNPISSISRLTALKHKDADRRDLIRKRVRLGARFCPFVIIARVSQCSNESKGMRLE